MFKFSNPRSTRPIRNPRFAPEFLDRRLCPSGTAPATVAVVALADTSSQTAPTDTSDTTAPSTAALIPNTIAAPVAPVTSAAPASDAITEPDGSDPAGYGTSIDPNAPPILPPAPSLPPGSGGPEAGPIPTPSDPTLTVYVTSTS